MSDPNGAAIDAVTIVATELGVKVDPKLIIQLAEFLIGALGQDKWGDAVIAGIHRASKVTDVASAEAAAVERNR